MMSPLRYLRLLLLALLPVTAVAAGGAAVSADVESQLAALADSMEVSVLTCSPGPASYERYGHTALRIRKNAPGGDYVFNYGVFSFDQPFFFWRFALGQTDYQVAAVPSKVFLREYERQQRAVSELVLALNGAEKLRLLQELFSNLQDPEWTYRYNFLRDNCTTRVVELVRTAVGGRLELPKPQQQTTYRRIIDGFAAEAAPWETFGQNLLLGAAVDTLLLSGEEAAFPLCAEPLLEGASVADATGRRPLVAQRRQLLSEGEQPIHAPWLTPLQVACLLLVLVGVLCLFQLRGSRRAAVAARWTDNFLMFVQGLAGCLVCLLFGFSEHPAVDSNWLVVLLNPLPLLWLPVKVAREGRGKPDCYVRRVQPVLLLLYAVALVQQAVPAALTVLALSLLLRSVAENIRFMQPGRCPLAGSERGRQKANNENIPIRHNA